MECCSCCSKQTFWSFFDVSETMDRRASGSVRRSDFLWALSALGTSIPFQRAVRKSGLLTHFHSTAGDLTLEGFLRLALPNLTSADWELMRGWAGTRRAQNLLSMSRHEFSGRRSQMRQIFEILRNPLNLKSEPGLEEGAEITEASQEVQEPAPRPEPRVDAEQVARAGILSSAEVLAILGSRSWGGSGTRKFLKFEEFFALFQPAFVERFCSKPPEAESPDWRGFKETFQASLGMQQRSELPPLPPLPQATPRARLPRRRSDRRCTQAHCLSLPAQVLA